MNAIDDIFGRRGVAIAMVHVRALPATPGFGGDIDKIVRSAVEEATTLANIGFDGVLIENMHDTPYLVGDEIGPEIVAGMTRVGLAVREAIGDVAMGVQVLAAGNRQAIAIAQTIGAAFVRVENFAYAHVADEGLLARASAGELLRYRRAIGAENVRVFADIKKKHAGHSLTADIPIGEMARGAEFCGAEGVIVTGGATGQPATEADLAEVRGATDIPLLIGSGVNASNVALMLGHGDAVIVGSSLKVGGRWENELDPEACRAFIAALRRDRC